MAAKVKLFDVAERKVPVQIDGGEFFIHLRPITFADELAAIVAQSPLASRVESTVCGWSELFDESGNEIEFSSQRLAALCRMHPIVATRIIESFREMASGGVSEGERKNSTPLP